MSQEQVESLVRTLLKLAGGYFIQHGFVDNSNMEIIAAGLTALLGVVMSHRNHALPSVPEAVKTTATKA